MRLCMLVGAALALNAQDQRTGGGVNFYSTEKEVALGKQIAADFRTDARLARQCGGSRLHRANGRAAASGAAAALPLHLSFRADHRFNGHIPGTASLSGGYIFVPAGLILAAKDEEELAGALAHAMAHIAARHFTRQAARGETAQLATIPLIFWGGLAGYGWSQNPPVLLPVGMLQFQRANEAEADVLAVGIAAAAGYDPEGLASYVGRVQEDPAQPSMSGFPPRDQRIQAIEQAIQALPAKTYASSGDFAQIQEEVRRAQAPAPPKLKPTLQR